MSKRQSKSGSRNSRKLRRANEAEQRKVKPLKANGSSYASVEQVNAVVQQLNDNQAKLGQIVNQTNTGIIKAFTIQDGHLHVMRRVYNDMAKDCFGDDAEYTMLADDNSINWDWYYKQYELYKVVVAFVMWIKKMQGEDITPKDEDELEEEGVDFSFGGDYEPHTNSSEG